MPGRDDGEPNGRYADWTRGDVRRFEQSVADLRALQRNHDVLSSTLDATNKKMTEMSTQLTGLSRDFWYVKTMVLGFGAIILIAFANALLNIVNAASASSVTP